MILFLFLYTQILLGDINISMNTNSVCILCNYMFIMCSLNVIASNMKCGPNNVRNQNRMVLDIEKDVDIEENL